MEESWYSSQDRYGFLHSLLLVALRKVSHRVAHRLFALLRSLLLRWVDDRYIARIARSRGSCYNTRIGE